MANITYESGSNFIDDVLNGKAIIDDIDDYVDYWHNHPLDKSLREFLGMTDKEYMQFVIDTNSNALSRIIEERRKVVI